MKLLFVDDLPAVIENDTIYVVGNWCIVFKCPCGCNEDVRLNIIIKAKGCPKWSYTINDDKTITVNPSINRLSGCKSHFWIRNSKIIMC